MSDWIPVRKRHPGLGDKVLIFRQGYDEYHVAYFDRDFLDRRTFAFYETAGYYVYKVKGDGSQLRNIWSYTPTHWMPLPAPPEKIKPEPSK